jgi:hypothetical protein
LNCITITCSFSEQNGREQKNIAGMLVEKAKGG